MKQRGVALVLVLWIMSLLMLMAGSFSLTMRRESTGVSGSLSQAKAIAQAQGGVALAQAMLLHEDESKRWRVDGSVYEISTQHAVMRIQIQSQAGKIDINSAPMTLLHHVFQYAPLDSQAQLNVENAILDWRDADDTPRPFGAEKDDYQKAKLHYAPRNKPFRSMAELQMVRGMTEEVLAWMQPIFTVYAAGQTDIDYALAPRDVLAVLPEVDVNLLDTYFIARQKSAATNAPPPAIPRRQNAGQAMVQEMQDTTEPASAPEISVVSVIVEVQLDDDEKSTAQIEVMMEKIDGANNLPFQQLTWKTQTDYAQTHSLFGVDVTPLLRFAEHTPQNDTL
ncbi:MAG TPA: general secretion pathway protein GspK [Methylococcaceae bacterium]|nr:general secretion pathway protein GspK [Methylococcaceae bacterium]